MSKYPSTFFRVSVKAIIKNQAGHVLVCKENSPNWNLPGGGIEHGEDPITALQRELSEEVGLSFIPQAAQLHKAINFFVAEKDIHMLWMVYKIAIDTPQIVLGPEVSEADFIDIARFEGSVIRSERIIYTVTR